MAILKTLKKVTDNRFLNMYEGSFFNEKTGKDFKYWFTTRRKEEEIACLTLDHNKCDAVAIVPTFANGDIVLIKEYRAPINDYIYSFPAGLVDPGESVYDAIARELKEETGLDIVNCNEILKPCYTSAGMSDETVAMYAATVEGEINLDHKSENEDIDVVIIKKEDAVRFADENLVAIKTALILKLM